MLVSMRGGKASRDACPPSVTARRPLCDVKITEDERPFADPGTAKSSQGL
ncbi:hypothetical protein SCANM124S_00301 [Streptomyces canus]